MEDEGRGGEYYEATMERSYLFTHDEEEEEEGGTQTHKDREKKN
jgi:hypothetical protein